MRVMKVFLIVYNTERYLVLLHFARSVHATSSLKMFRLQRPINQHHLVRIK